MMSSERYFTKVSCFWKLLNFLQSVESILPNLIKPTASRRSPTAAHSLPSRSSGCSVTLSRCRSLSFRRCNAGRAYAASSAKSSGPTSLTRCRRPRVASTAPPWCWCSSACRLSSAPRATTQLVDASTLRFANAVSSRFCSLTASSVLSGARRARRAWWQRCCAAFRSHGYRSIC